MILENNNMNLPEVSVTELVDLLSRTYSRAASAGFPFSDVPSAMLWGPAGIGKSEAVKETAERLASKTGKRVEVTDIRLLLFSPADLRGIPSADAERKFAVWLMPRIFDLDPGEGTINILFLDEISACTQSIQAAAYQITLDRKIGEFRLPANTIVIAAGNRTTDQSVSYKMPKALCNRLLHFNVCADYESWKRWAIKAGIDERVIGFTGFDRAKFCAEPGSSDFAYTTPRSWTFVSNILKLLDPERSDPSPAHNMIAAAVGADTAVAFEAWCRVCGDLPSVDEIMRGSCRRYPGSQDALFALSAGLVRAVHDRGKLLRMDELEHVCGYAANFPTDFAMSFFNDVKDLDNVKPMILKCGSVKAWLARNKRNL